MVLTRESSVAVSQNRVTGKWCDSFCSSIHRLHFSGHGKYVLFRLSSRSRRYAIIDFDVVQWSTCVRWIVDQRSMDHYGSTLHRRVTDHVDEASSTNHLISLCRNTNPTAYRILFGLHDRLSQEGWVISRNVQRIVVHPNYASRNFLNDIALMQLSVSECLLMRVRFDLFSSKLDQS